MGYESLFTPFKIGNMEVKNRIGLSPMGTNSAFTNGRKDAQEIDYFIERSKGGTGILYMGCQMLNEQIRYTEIFCRESIHLHSRAHQKEKDMSSKTGIRLLLKK